MALKYRYNLQDLMNITMEMVCKRVEEIIEERDDFCHCTCCVLDIIAYTMNNVTPLYRTSMLGSLNPNKEKEKKVLIEIEVAIEEGIKLIRQHPHHDVKIL